MKTVFISSYLKSDKNHKIIIMKKAIHIYFCLVCVSDDHCPGGVCNTSIHLRLVCVSDDHCPGGVCKTSIHLCLVCVTDDHCPGGICNTSIHLC